MSSAYDAVTSAIDAAAQKGGKKGFEEMLLVLARDAGQLDQRFEPVTLANQQLWPMPKPLLIDWVREGWEALKVRLLTAHENWDVWTIWYEDRMFGNMTDTALEVSRAAEVPDAAWNQGPKSANTFIQRQLRGEYFNKDRREPDPPDPGDAVAFQQWLSAKPQEWAAVIAARAALRMLPTLSASPGDATMLAIVRGMAASRYVVSHPQSTKVARDAAEFLRNRETHVALSAFYAASAIGDIDAPGCVTRIISDLGYRLDPPRVAAVLRDSFALLHGMPPKALARAPLWFPENDGGTPPAVRQAWTKLAQALENGRRWQVWVDWYDYVLEGSPPATRRDDDWEASFVDIPHPLPWEAGALAVNTEIAARLGSKSSSTDEPNEVALGSDPLPLDNIESPIAIFQRPDGRIGADAGTLATPYLPLPLTEAEHSRTLSACRSRAERVRAIAIATGFQGRREYADAISAYLEWLPPNPGIGNILLADGEARVMNKLAAADDGILPIGFAAQLSVFLEEHIGLRVFYPEIERHYLAVRTGRLVKPLRRDAVEGFQRAVHANTPSVFHESVVAVVDEVAKPVPEVKPPRPEDAPLFDPSYPRAPKDPIADIDPAQTRSFILASGANRIWKILLEGKDVPAAIAGWHRAYEQIKPFIGHILSFLRGFAGGDGGTPPPMPPTIMT
jgi:hypothetical protein